MGVTLVYPLRPHTPLEQGKVSVARIVTEFDSLIARGRAPNSINHAAQSRGVNLQRDLPPPAYEEITTERPTEHTVGALHVQKGR